MASFGYYLDKHLDEFEDFVRIRKDSKILDVAAGTGFIGEKVVLKYISLFLMFCSTNFYISLCFKFFSLSKEDIRTLMHWMGAMEC